MATFLAAATAALAASGPVFADSAPADSDVIPEIVVTAEKRSETLQSVPVSVTALTGAQLGQLKLDTPSDLVTQVPNLQVNGIVGEGSPLFSLRGVSMFDYSLNQSSPVASYIDEVYKGNFTLFGVELYDLERVEVLRGPQGTLYGKNTTGGAINFITHKPGFDTEGDIKVGLGDYNRREVEGAFQTAVVPERIAARFAFTYTKVDGFIQNVLPGIRISKAWISTGCACRCYSRRPTTSISPCAYRRACRTPRITRSSMGAFLRRRPATRVASASPGISERSTAPTPACR